MLGSIVFTPFNLAFWGAANPHTRPILEAVALSPSQVFGTIVLLLGVLTVVGTFLSDLLLLWIDPRIRMEGKR
jgi:hypothetical protein